MPNDDFNYEIDLGDELESQSGYNKKSSNSSQLSKSSSHNSNSHSSAGNNNSSSSHNNFKDGSNDSQNNNQWNSGSSNQFNKGFSGGSGNFNPNFNNMNMKGGSMGMGNMNNNNNFFNPIHNTAANTNKTTAPASALLIENLNWWVNEEEVRAWAVDADVDADVKIVIFDEHKVNGKSKGYASKVTQAHLNYSLMIIYIRFFIIILELFILNLVRHSRLLKLKNKLKDMFKNKLMRNTRMESRLPVLQLVLLSKFHI